MSTFKYLSSNSSNGHSTFGLLMDVLVTLIIIGSVAPALLAGLTVLLLTLSSQTHTILFLPLDDINLIDTIPKSRWNSATQTTQVRKKRFSGVE